MNWRVINGNTTGFILIDNKMFFEKYISIGWCLAGVRVGLLILILGLGRWHVSCLLRPFFPATIGAFIYRKVHSRTWREMPVNSQKSVAGFLNVSKINGTGSAE
jgi:hypothetical protein